MPNRTFTLTVAEDASLTEIAEAQGITTDQLILDKAQWEVREYDRGKYDVWWKGLNDAAKKTVYDANQ
jgi:hypothetical protein